MNKKIISTGILFATLFSLGGCSTVGSKTATMSVVYVATSFLALALLIGYLFLIKKKDPWFILLFSAVTVINIGYLSLSVSNTLNEALLANRISYLGSVLLPVSMLMSIVKTCNIKFSKWLVGVLLGISAVVFIIAASPGYLDIYYKEVSLVVVDGVSILEKVYGPLHSVYLYYLLGYFSAMIAVAIFAKITKRIKTSVQAVLILSSVLVNIGIWLMEQLVKFDFEFLSVSYIVSEVFLLGISLLIESTSMQSFAFSKSNAQEQDFSQNFAEEIEKTTPDIDKKREYLCANLHTLTPTEHEVYRLYLQGKRTKDVMEALSITENTLKYHNRNLYSKLGVANRKELVEIAKQSENINV